jgi:hypothetical protein
MVCAEDGAMLRQVHFDGGSGGCGSGETVHFTLLNCQGGMRPAAWLFANVSATQFNNTVLSWGVSGRS